MEITQNVFNKGLNTDTDEYVLDNQTMRYAQNIRLSQSGDNNYVLQNVDGNTFEFELTRGFVPIGYTNDNFGTYIFSYNELTNQGEIGSYPSLNYEVEYIQNSEVETIYPFVLYPENHHARVTNRNVLEENAVKVNKYAPLYNYTTDFNLDGYFAFRSKLFNFQLDKAIVHQAVTKQSYDYSFNLYFTDNHNPVRTVNGSIVEYQNRLYLNKKLYKPFNFSTDINLILGSTVLTSFTTPVVGDGGNMKAGNYTFYMVYKADEVRTSPICSTNKVSIYYTANNINYGGSKEISALSEETETNDLRTNKKVTLNLFNVDEGYSRFRIWVEYNDGFDISNTTYYEIDRDYNINLTAESVVLSGFEATIPLSEGQINSLYYDLFKAKTIAQTDSRLFLGNISIPEQDVEVFREIALQFEPTFTFNQNVFNINTEPSPYIDINSNTVLLNENNGGYIHYLNVYNKLGYWGGETYAFAVVFKLTNGTETQAFPIIGKDFSTIGEPINLKGLVKFPYRNILNGGTDTLYDYNTKRFKGLSLNITIPAITNPNIVGYKIVRADRNKHCIAQGYLSQTSSILNGNRVDSNLGNTYTADFAGAYGLSYPDRSYNGTSFTASGRQIYIQDPNRIRRVIPTPFGLLETETLFSTTGMLPNSRLTNGRIIDDFRYAFYSSDSQSDRSIRDILNDNNVDIRVEAQLYNNPYHVSSLFALPSFSNSTLVALFNEDKVSVDQTIINNRAWQVDTGRELTNGKFSSAILALNHSNVINSNHYFEQYTGIITDKPLTAITNNPNSLFTDISDNTLNLPIKSVATTDITGLSSKVGFLLVNLYEDVNLTPEQLYPNTTTLQYKKVTDYMAVSTISNAIQVYNGDCYVGFNYKKLWYSDVSRNQSVDNGLLPTDPNFSVNGKTGVLLQLITENNTNPYLRANEVVNINERNAENTNYRSYFPLMLNGLANDTNIIGDTFTNIANQTGNWHFTSYSKYYQIAESTRQNKGYNVSLESKRYTLDDNTIDFISNSFITRVVYSEQQVGLTLKDSYREIGLLNTQDYDITKGQIYNLQTQGGQIVAVQNSCVTLIAHKERIPINKDEQIFVDGVGVLSPYARYLDNYGTQHTHSIIKSDRTIYGVDVNNGVIWRVEGDSLELLSENVISAYLYDDDGLVRTDAYTRDYDLTNYNQVRTYYDRYNNEILFCWFNSENPESTFTLCYNESLNIFTSFYTFLPSLMIRKSSNLYSAKIGTNRFFNHYTSESIRNTFYNEYGDTVVEFVTNEPLDISKVYDNHAILGNNIYPSEMKWETENQEATRSREWLLNRRRLRQEENRVFVVIGSSDTDKNEKYNHNRLNSRIRDKYMKVRIKYDTTKHLRISRIITKYRISYV